MIICPICKSQSDEYHLKKLEDNCRFFPIAEVNQHLIRYQCNICDVIFGSKEMLNLSNEKLSKAYRDVYASGYRENDATSYEESLFYMLNPEKSGTYINWGAGTSSTSERVRQAGFNLLNYDPGIPNTTYLNKEDIKNIRVDGIISNNVLDHLQDPISDLLLMKSILKSNGTMIHASDGFEYIISYTKFHLFFFVGKSVDFISKSINMDHTFLPSSVEGSLILKLSNK